MIATDQQSTADGGGVRTHHQPKISAAERHPTAHHSSRRGRPSRLAGSQVRSQTMTRRQLELYRFIEKYWAVHDLAPTYEEMAEFMGVRSLATVWEHIANLKRLGFVESDYNCARSVRPVSERCPLCGSGRGVEGLDR